MISLPWEKPRMPVSRSRLTSSTKGDVYIVFISLSCFFIIKCIKECPERDLILYDVAERRHTGSIG